MKKTELQYIFRQPKFPLIVSIEGYFIGAETPAHFLEQLNRVPVDEKGIYDLVDGARAFCPVSPADLAAAGSG